METLIHETYRIGRDKQQTSGSQMLPERFSRRAGAVGVATDAAVLFVLALISLNGAHGNRIAAAVLTAGVICTVFWLCGYYRESYAVYARDEVYYACAGVMLAALPVALFLCAVGRIPGASVAVALVLCAAGASIVHVRLHLGRRGERPVVSAGTRCISAAAWNDREQPSYEVPKRIFDLTVAFGALVVFAPLMAAAAITIALESRGPVLFRQQRVGRNGVPFTIFKFRTMRPDAGNDWAKPGDERITGFGAFLRRTSFDELPQLFNVLRGEMSIVGPRPEMVSFASQFGGTLRNYSHRVVVAPGITGWAQLYLQRNLQPDDMPRVLPYDLFYVEHASALLDAALLFKTGAEVLFHRAV
ncbi:MAG: sugar transferase [Candidatus Baltobacteraceae bacterium]